MVEQVLDIGRLGRRGRARQGEQQRDEPRARRATARARERRERQSGTSWWLALEVAPEPETTAASGPARKRAAAPARLGRAAPLAYPAAMPTEPAPRHRDGTLWWTALALVAFATNSILCRLALGRRSIDPAAFTAIRLLAGAVTLWVVHTVAGARAPAAPAARSGADWISAAALFGYAASFSLAYMSLGAGTGALILFGSVQATMILAALKGGERFRIVEAVGLAVALGGLVYLTLPGVTAPAPMGAVLMTTAGIAWGAYSMRGRGASDPLGHTRSKFARALPMAAGMVLLSARHLHCSPAGALLAAASGALASGLGYVIWYIALRGLTAIRAATVQLAVPVLAAAGGVLVLGERVTMRLVLAALLILGGVGLAIAGLGARAAGVRAATDRR